MGLHNFGLELFKIFGQLRIMKEFNAVHMQLLCKSYKFVFDFFTRWIQKTCVFPCPFRHVALM